MKTRKSKRPLVIAISLTNKIHAMPRRERDIFGEYICHLFGKVPHSLIVLPPRCCKTLRQVLPNIVARGESKRSVNKITSFQGYFSIVGLKTLGQKAQTYLRPEEYARLLSAAGSNPRDFAILQLFLQTVSAFPSWSI